MDIVRKSERKEFRNGDNCIAFEYALGDDDIDGAVIELTGRYPEEGYVVNEVCKELVYVTSGTGTLTSHDSELKLEPGDLAMLQPNKPYFFDGTMELLISCAPAWYPEQHKHLPA